MRITILSALITGISGWSVPAHERIASIAHDHLNDDTKVVLKAISSPERGRGKNEKSLTEWMEEVSDWADTDAGKAKDSGKNHFVHVREGHPIETRFKCDTGPAGLNTCITHAIVRHTGKAMTLYNTVTKPEDVREAIKFLIHYMGDIHQPLHVALEIDRGGGEIILDGPYKAQIEDTRRMRKISLHEAWDNQLYNNAFEKGMFRSSEFPTMTTTSLDYEPAQFVSEKAALDRAELIASETAQVAAVFAYKQAGGNITSGDYLSKEYIADARAKIAEQIERAGLRLASLLNEIARIRIAREAEAAQALRRMFNITS
jgi:hypothetical protein